MSWKVHETDEVFAGLRGLCSNVYRMYDPCEYRYYYDHDCDVYECAVEDAADEYERLLRHCDHQREQLKAWGNASTLRKIMEDGMDATFGNGWVKLPVDADGVPIHIGDLMEADGDVFNVLSMELFYDGSWSIRNDVGNGFEYWELHHVKPDSWERIIADAVKNGMYDHDNEHIQQKLVERCRRLAGDAE